MVETHAIVWICDEKRGFELIFSLLLTASVLRNTKDREEYSGISMQGTCAGGLCCSLML